MVVFNDVMAVDLLPGFVLIAGSKIKEIRNEEDKIFYGIEITNYQNGDEITNVFMCCAENTKEAAKRVFHNILSAYLSENSTFYFSGGFIDEA